MAVTFATGLEGQQAAIDGITLTGTVAYSTAQAQTGAASIRCNPASGASGYVGGASGLYAHFGLRIAMLPSVARCIAGQTGTGHVRLNSDGTLSYYNGASLVATGATVLSTATWYWIGWRAPSGTTVAAVQINGQTEITCTTVAAAGGTFGCNGTEASAIDIYIDDYIGDNAGFLAPSKVDLALPISDNTRTAVTTGNGGTTNLWDAVNNTPPTGVASASETATTNIEYPASLTEDYIANLETYTTLGIASGDTVLAVRAIVQHGEDIATGTKSLQTVGALTNPTVAGNNSLAGGDVGAHGASPTNWYTEFTAITTSPSVTLGTSPTIRTSRISESRVACIDFMGMLVAWTPAAAANTRVPYVNRMPQLLAH